MKRINPPLFFVMIFLVMSCSGKQESKNNTANTNSANDTTQQQTLSLEEPQIPKDSLLDAKARFIAGLPQLQTNSYAALENDPYWKEYRASIDTSWTKMYNGRLKKMKDWQATDFSAAVNDSLPLFYPFSGPDFLHAHYLYPHTKEFVLAALEPIIQVAALDSIKLKQRDQFLDSLNHSLRDIFYKSYFITTHMQQDLKQIRGVLPAFYFFIERSGHELLAQEFITLDSLGDAQPVKGSRVSWQKVPGVKLTFRNIETKQVKTLYYFSLDISNKGLQKKPAFMKFLSKRMPFNTFVKSASYLMHNPTFTDIKEHILTHGESIFQDDTGVPYRDFKKRLDLQVQFYGEYVKPVKDFGSYLFQADLDSAYKTSTNKKELPFSLGYHWSTKIQNYMLMTKSSKTSTTR